MYRSIKKERSISNLNLINILDILKVKIQNKLCHSRTRLHECKLRRESRLKSPYMFFYNVIIDWIPSYEGMTIQKYIYFLGF